MRLVVRLPRHLAYHGLSMYHMQENLLLLPVHFFLSVSHHRPWCFIDHYDGRLVDVVSVVIIVCCVICYTITRTL